MTTTTTTTTTTEAEAGAGAKTSAYAPSKPVTKAIAKNGNRLNSGSHCVFPVIWNPLKDALFVSQCAV